MNLPAGRVEHREHRADRNVGVDAVRTVERIERDQKGAVGVERHGLIAFFRQDRANACAAEPADEGLVRKNVERLLRGSVVVRADGLIEVAGQFAATDEVSDREGCFGNRAKNPGERLGHVGGQKGAEIPAGLKRACHEPLPVSAPSRLLNTTIQICVSMETDLILPEGPLQAVAAAGSRIGPTAPLAAAPRLSRYCDSSTTTLPSLSPT